MEIMRTVLLKRLATAAGMVAGISQLLPFQREERSWFAGKEKELKREAKGWSIAQLSNQMPTDLLSPIFHLLPL